MQPVSKIVISLLFVSFSIAFAHEYDTAGLYEVDKNWMLHRGDLELKKADSPAVSWQAIPYDNEEVVIPDYIGEREIIWLSAALPVKKIIDPLLLFEEMLPDYQVYYNDSLLFSAGSVSDGQRQNFRGDERRMISLTNIKEGQLLYFRIRISEDPLLRRLARVHIGRHSDFISSFIETDLKYVILGFFFIFSSVIPFATYIRFRRSLENAALGLLTVSFGVLTLSESVFFDQWLGSGEVFLYVVEPFSFLSAVSLCLYFEAIFGTGWKSNLKILRYINLFLMLIGFPVFIIFQPPAIYWMSVKIVFFILLFLIILSTFLLGLSLARQGNKDARTVIIGYSALSIFGMLDILGGVFVLFPWSPGWYPWGILVLVIVLQYNTQYRLKKFSSDLENSRNQLMESRFETLKSQINPHFLFNSLNTLSSLIFIDRELASAFVRDLSKVYRFILETRDKERIALDEELKILEAYICLVQTRFKESLQIHVEKSVTQQEKEIAPLCLQMLIENAIKHNITSKNRPLKIRIFYESPDYIVVENNMQPKSTKEFSSRLGLKNISNRYTYLTQRPVIIEESNNTFTVKIPLL